MGNWNSAIIIPLTAAFFGGAFTLTGAYLGATWARQNTDATIAAGQARSEQESLRAACLRTLQDMEAVKTHFIAAIEKRVPTTPDALQVAYSTATTLIEQTKRDEVEWSLLTRDPKGLAESTSAIYGYYESSYLVLQLTFVSQVGDNPEPGDAGMGEGSQFVTEVAALSARCRTEAGLPPR